MVPARSNVVQGRLRAIRSEASGGTISIKGERKRGADERRSGGAGERKKGAGERKRGAGERRSSGDGEMRYDAGRKRPGVEMRRLVGDTKSNGDTNMSGAGRKKNAAGRKENGAGERGNGGDMNRATGGCRRRISSENIPRRQVSIRTTGRLNPGP
jgi:hypothetical protein